MTSSVSGKKLKCAQHEAASASIVVGLKETLRKNELLDPVAAKWLEDKSPSQWSKSHFSFMSKDMLINNVCESYNSLLRDAKEMLILSMFEWIRNYHMVRFQRKRERVKLKWDRKKKYVLRL